MNGEQLYAKRDNVFIAVPFFFCGECGELSDSQDKADKCCDNTCECGATMLPGKRRCASCVTDEEFKKKNQLILDAEQVLEYKHLYDIYSDEYFSCIEEAERYYICRGNEMPRYMFDCKDVSLKQSPPDIEEFLKQHTECEIGDSASGELKDISSIVEFFDNWCSNQDVANYKPDFDRKIATRGVARPNHEQLSLL